ncbi:MAG: CoA transferase [Chloroflexi bacterium]|nr:CoA transferase [Chloroflexota bacterium]MCH8284304.1 CoA transferase [Chloroflexota bacterium]
MRSPLDGITILDLTIWQNGPWGTVMLSDMGANVIKIENPIDGDPGRNVGMLGPSPAAINSYFETMNRNKRSMTLNLKCTEGREIFMTMAKKADVITQNFRVGVVDRLGIGYEAIKEINPKIIYASSSGLGDEGPDARDGIFDILGQARGGFMWMTSLADPEVRYRVAGGMADQTGAIILAYAVMSAVVARERFGVGQHVQVSQLGGQLIIQALALNGFLLNGSVRAMGDRKSATNPLFSIYRCGDEKWIALGCIQSDRYWPQLVAGLDAPELMEDPRFTDHATRYQNYRPLIDKLDEIFATRTRDEWVKELKPRGVNIGPVQTYEDLPNDPQVIANNYLVELEHPVHGTLKEVGVAIKMSETQPYARTAAPEFGAHTEEILQEFGYSWDQIEQYRDKSVL